MPQTSEGATAEKHTYNQILKSSALIGGSSVLKIAIGIIRTKAMAVFLGPAGFGLMGLYASIADLASSIAGMGINSSGVRQIAEAVGSGKTERIAQTAVVLRRTSIILGIVGALFLVVFSKQVSLLTFGSDQHATAVALLSLAVFFSLVSGGQGALIQGMRRIADLAKMGVLGALFGTVISIPMVYVWRDRGIVPSLIAMAALTIVTSWWYSRKISILKPSLTVAQVGQESLALLKWGFAFMASGLIVMGTAYAVRVIVLRQGGFAATGLYQSAWALAGLYVRIILQAMGADFYPRLTAKAGNDRVCNRMVNEQAQVGLLLACPGVMATLTFAPLVISIFYSGRFDAAGGLLRWLCLGATLQVVSWPMAYIFLVKGRQTLFLFSDFAWGMMYIGLAWVCVRRFGVNGAGIAFFGAYVFQSVLTYMIVRSLSGYRWSVDNKRVGLLLLAMIATVFSAFYVLPGIWPIVTGAVTTILGAVCSIRVLLTLVSVERIPRPLRVWVGRDGLK